MWRRPTRGEGSRRRHGEMYKVKQGSASYMWRRPTRGEGSRPRHGDMYKVIGSRTGCPYTAPLPLHCRSRYPCTASTLHMHHARSALIPCRASEIDHCETGTGLGQHTQPSPV